MFWVAYKTGTSLHDIEGCRLQVIIIFIAAVLWCIKYNLFDAPYKRLLCDNLDCECISTKECDVVVKSKTKLVSKTTRTSVEEIPQHLHFVDSCTTIIIARKVHRCHGIY